MNNKHNSNFEIVFGGEAHDIDVDVLIESVVNYSLIIQEVSAHISPKTKVNIRIKAPEKGSFIISMDIVTDTVTSLFSQDVVAYGSGLITILGGVVGLYRFFAKNGKDHKVQEINNKMKITAKNNATITVENNTFNIYQESPKIREKIRSTFEKMQQYEEIKSFELRSSTTPELKIEKDDFPMMASKENEVEKNRRISSKENQELHLFKIVFEENYKWEFYYEGHKIFVSMKDVSFFEKIKSGEIAFRSGDRLIANIEIDQVFSDAANTYVNEDYRIVKIIEHIPRNTDVVQTSIIQD